MREWATGVWWASLGTPLLSSHRAKGRAHVHISTARSRTNLAHPIKSKATPGTPPSQAKLQRQHRRQQNKSSSVQEADLTTKYSEPKQGATDLILQHTHLYLFLQASGRNHTSRQSATSATPAMSTHWRLNRRRAQSGHCHLSLFFLPPFLRPPKSASNGGVIQPRAPDCPMDGRGEQTPQLHEVAHPMCACG